MTGEELTRKRVQIINEKRFGDLSEVLSPTILTHYGQQDIHGIEQLAEALAGFNAFTDLETSIEALVVDGDKIGARYVTRGIHTDTFFGVEATGRKVAFGGASINHIADGKITETWTVDDLAALMRQIGDSPASPRTDAHPITGMSGEAPSSGQTDIKAAKRMLYRWIELTNLNAFDELREVFADDLIVHPGEDLEDVRGFNAFKDLLTSFYVGMPDLQITIEDVVGADDALIMRTTSRATHAGKLFGIPGTGRKVTYTGVSTYRVADGKLAVEWFNDDMLALTQQLTAQDADRVPALREG